MSRRILSNWPNVLVRGVKEVNVTGVGILTSHHLCLQITKEIKYPKFNIIYVEIRLAKMSDEVKKFFTSLLHK